MKILKQIINTLFILILVTSITIVGCNSNNVDVVPGAIAVNNPVPLDDAISNDVVETLPLDTFNFDEHQRCAFPSAIRLAQQ